jgi:hypothetical protein
MKKLKQRLTRHRSEQGTEPTVDARVTNDTVSRHREEMLSRARKFKYPFYRSKHRVALISISLAFVALLLLGVISSLRLYINKDTGEFSYRVTQIIPFPVAKVNGSYTSYESYLFQLRHNVFWLEQFGTTDLRSPDGKRQIDYLKRGALDQAMELTIAKKFAKKNNVHVSSKEVDELVNQLNKSGGDLKSILKSQLNLTVNEYRRLTKDEILKAKAAKAVDKDAPNKAKKILEEILAGKDFAKVAKESSDDEETKQLGGAFGVVEKGKANLPKEVSDKVFNLKKGQVSEVIETPTSYFIVKVTDVVDKNHYKISIIKVAVKSMSSYLSDYKKQGKVKEYVKLNEVNSLQIK